MKRWMLLWVAVFLLLPWVARSEAMVKLDGRGAHIGLLREYETEWASLREEIEAVSAQVGLSSEKVDGCVFTVDQVAASDGYLLVFFTVTSDEPFVLPKDKSIYGRQEQTGFNLKACLDGNEASKSGLHARGLDDEEVFFRDEHTLVGWTLLSSVFYPIRIPEVCQVKLTASVGIFILDTKMDVSFTLDRSTKLPGFYEGDIDVPLTYTLPDDLGLEGSLRFTHLSMSPLGNLLTVEQELDGVGGYAWPTVFDEAGEALMQPPGAVMAEGSPQHPLRVEQHLAFVGGRGGRKLTLAPSQWGGGHTARLPLDVALPYTHTDERGRRLFTLLSLSMDRNGMQVRYRSECDGLDGEVRFWLFQDEEGQAIDSLGYASDDRLDRSNGIRTLTLRWSPEKGAAPGERLTQETFERLRTVEIQAGADVPMMEYAVEIEISGA